MTTTPTQLPVPSETSRDLKFNAGKIDEFVTSLKHIYKDRFGQEHYTIEGLRWVAQQAIAAFGYITIDSFEEGALITLPNQVLRWKETGEYYRWDGDFGVEGKVVQPGSTPDSTGGIGSRAWMSVGDAALRQNLASSGDGFGDFLVTVKQPFTGSAIITQHDKNTQTCHINDFPSTPANTWLKRAIAGTPVGWTLQLGIGPYIGNYTESRSNITIQGVGLAPIANGERTELVSGSGTIVQGSTKFTGSDVKIIGIGFDNGNNVVASLNAGVEGDALAVSNVGVSLVPNKNNQLINISTLAKLNSTTSHSCLLENFTHGIVQNVKGFGGFVGVVCKIQNSAIDNVSGYRNTQSGVQFKSNSYAQFSRNTVGRIYADDEGFHSENSVGIFIYAETAQLQHFIGGVLSARGFASGVSISMTSGHPINDIDITSINSENPRAVGVSVFGEVIHTNLGHVQVTGAVTGRSIYLDPKVLGVVIDDIQASCPESLNLDDSVSLGGVFSVGSIVATQLYNPAVLTGISVTPGNAAPTGWRIGSYVGRLIMNKVTLINGWIGRSSNTPTLRLNGSVATLNAYLTVPTPRNGAEVFTQVPEGMRPQTPQFFPCLGFLSATASPVMIMGAANTTGEIYFPYLSNAAQFPVGVVAVAINIQWSIS